MTYLEKYKSKIYELCVQHNVRNLYVFGSVATGRFTTNSDIDFSVIFQDVQLSEYADNYFEFKFSLESLLKKSIDLLEENAIKNPYLKKSIDKQKILIYG